MKALPPIVVTSLFAAFVLSAPAREWTDSSGRKLEADFISSDGKSVEVKRASDGKSYTLPLAKLSAEDQEWVKAEMARPVAPKPVEGPWAAKLTGDWVLGESGKLPYAIFGTKDLDGSKKYPLVLALHGKTSNDENGKQMTGWTRIFAKPENYAKHPCIIVAPLCYQPHGETGGGWNGAPPGEEAIILVKQIIKELGIVDENRVYAFGSSMGGFGTTWVLNEEPKLFAAGISTSGCSPNLASGLKRMPYRLYHAADDKVVDVEGSRQMAEALKRNKDFKYTEFETGGHGIAGQVFNDPEVREWLFAQKR